jgi:hypothetical protein
MSGGGDRWVEFRLVDGEKDNTKMAGLEFQQSVSLVGRYRACDEDSPGCEIYETGVRYEYHGHQI